MQESQIQKEAQEILGTFATSLSKVKTPEKELKRPVGGFREEGPGQEASVDFRKRMFANAPKTDGDFILSEKRRWKE